MTVYIKTDISVIGLDITFTNQAYRKYGCLLAQILPKISFIANPFLTVIIRVNGPAQSEHPRQIIHYE